MSVKPKRHCGRLRNLSGAPTGNGKLVLRRTTGALRSVLPSEVGAVDFLVAEEVFAVVFADLAQDTAGVADGEYLQP